MTPKRRANATQQLQLLSGTTRDLPTPIGSPLGLHGLADSISRPAYATAVGLLQWALTHTSFLIEDDEPENNGLLSFASRLGRWLRAFIP